jgi:DNA polymerase-3 subunit beta
VQIIVERDIFADAVDWTARALPARRRCRAGGMRLHAGPHGRRSSFGYDVSALAKIPVDAQAPGGALVSADCSPRSARATK